VRLRRHKAPHPPVFVGANGRPMVDAADLGHHVDLERSRTFMWDTCPFCAKTGKHTHLLRHKAPG
jgi:hypothetical protein